MGDMSKSFIEQEQKNKEEAENTAQVKINKDERIYFHPAKKFQIANFVTEIKSQGRIDRPEASLEFQSNLYVTTDKEKQDFIENSNPYKNGHITRCKDMNEAVAMRHARNAAKQSNREVESTSITTVKAEM